MEKKSKLKIELDRQASEYESALFGQKERLFSLREENRRLKEELEAYKRKDGEVSEALLVALQKAREIEESARLKSELELKRLQEFHARWIRYYEEVRKLFPKDKRVENAGVFLAKMEKILELPAVSVEAPKEDAAFIREMEGGRERIKAALTAVTPEGGEAGAEGEFNMDDVLNPQNLAGLDELCKELLDD
ncbi:MAG: hypothetical protein IJF71_02430 [Clostridia bacterium]|nr:hypothetical protein [Clostridia bacterium]